MGSLYLTWLADELRAAGGQVKEYDANWKTRSRSSGGFNAAPLGVSWHHTAGAKGASAQSECDYMVKSSDAKPTCNIYIARDGVIWVLAAGATNTSGKGGPLSLSRGQVPLDSANTTTVGMEIGNAGTGETYSEAQINAAFLASNVINRKLGNKATDLFSHNLYAPTRKIDPATAAAVQGPWKPRSTTSSGTWNTDDIRSEATRRWSGAPTPPPEPVEEDVSGSSCVYFGGGRLDVFLTGQNDGHLYHRWYVPESLGGKGWTGYEDLGGVLEGAPSATGQSDGKGGVLRIDITGKGVDKPKPGLWHIWYVGGEGWQAWERVGDWPAA